MKALVVIPVLVARPTGYYNLPMGLLYVASAVRKLGHEVSILNLNEIGNKDYERVIRYRVQDVDVVLTGCLSVDYVNMKGIISLIKRHTKAPVVLGGGIVTAQPEIVADIIGADVYVSGECEDIMQEVLRFDKRIYKADKAVSVDTLNTLFPAYDLMNMELYLGLQRPSDGQYRVIEDNPRDAAIIASRGCPFNCTFCFHPTGLSYRQRSLDSIFTEVDMLVDRYNINILSVYDELFSTKKERLLEFCERIKKYKLKWSCQLRVDSVDEFDLRTMKDSGCYILSLGIESGSDVVLQGYKKHITVAKINKALELTKKIGLAVQGNILIGAENETPETIEESLSWWKEHYQYKLNITDVVAYPATEMYNNAVKAGKIEPVAFLEQGCPAMNLTGMPQEQYEAIRGDINKVTQEYGSKTTTVLFDLYTTGTDAFGRTVYNFKVNCPHCKSTVEYKNFAGDLVEQTIVFCKSCFMRFHIKAKGDM